MKQIIRERMTKMESWLADEADRRERKGLTRVWHMNISRHPKGQPRTSMPQDYR